MNNENEYVGIVTTNEEWEIGFISGEDKTCAVYCICGEKLWLDNRVQKCFCGRTYWTEFRVYRMETEEQYKETQKQYHSFISSRETKMENEK